MTAAQASLAPAADGTLRRGQGRGSGASLSAEGRRRGGLGCGRGAVPVMAPGALPPSSAGRPQGHGESRLEARACVSGGRDRPAFTPPLLVPCSRRELRLRNYVPEDEDLKKRRVPQAKPVAGQ